MLKILETLGVTFVGGMIFNWLHAPLSWMLGPLAAVLIWQGTTQRLLKWPTGCRNAGLALLGYGIGLSFTAESAMQILKQLPWMLLATVLVVGFCLILGYAISRGCGISASSAILGSVPGGLSHMVVLSEEYRHADRTIVTFMQTIRLLSVLFVVPFLAVHGLADANPPGGTFSLDMRPSGSAIEFIGGNSFPGLSSPWGLFAAAVFVPLAGWLAARLKLPAPWFLGPTIAAALMTVGGWGPPQLPEIVTIGAQWSLGIYLGLGIRFRSLSGWRRLLPYSLVSGLATVAFSIALSLVYSLILPMDTVTVFLGAAPGGMAEMGVTAAALHADVSMVIAYQMFRILFILLIVPFILRWLLGKPGNMTEADGIKPDF